MSTKAWHLPVRLATGLYILNSGLSKQGMDEERAKALAGWASTAYPKIRDLEPKQFAALLSAAEVALGTALLAVPFVPPLLAGLGLLGFGSALNRLYLKSPGTREPNSLRPTDQGILLAKDVWLTGTGAGLVLDSLSSARPSRRRR